MDYLIFSIADSGFNLLLHSPVLLSLKSLHTLFSFLIPVFFLAGCSKKQTEAQPVPNPQPNPIPVREFMRGADLSFMPEIRSAGATFSDSAGVTKDGLQIFKENGCNTVRIRIWNNPVNGRSALAEVQAFAAEVKANGMKVLLDFHYSDTWADPAHQKKPDAWKTLPDSTLADSVYRFTKLVVSVIRPEYVQIGNEINGGMLWENGRINKADAFTRFLKAGVKAVREELPNSKIIMHFAGLTSSDYFYNLLKTKTVDYDIIGLSFYPQWHGKNLDSLRNTVNRLSSTHNKSVLLAEYAYPFSLLWADYTNNTLGSADQILSAYPATPDGQYQYVKQLKKIMWECPKGIGLCYWAPDWIAYRGPTANNGSHAENQALFDFSRKALPAMKVFRADTL